MWVDKVIVGAGRVFNHPFESYSNLRPSVVIEARLEASEDYEVVVKSLQARAEELVEDHKRHMLQTLTEMDRMTRQQAEATRLASQIEECQSRLDRLRSGGVSSLDAPGQTADRDPEDIAF